MNYAKRRQVLFTCMGNDDALILYSGIELHISADDYFPFEANRHFFYLTGLRRSRMALLMQKAAGKTSEMLFIEETDPLAERWTGKMVTSDEAREISGIDDVRYVTSLDAVLGRVFGDGCVSTAWFDTYRYTKTDLPDYNVVKADEFASQYPGVRIRNIWPFVSALRMEKDEDEVAEIKEAIHITDQALQRVMKTLKPGMKEYQAQAEFEYMCHYLGAEGQAFATIAGSGMNGTMMHYETNRDTCEDNTLLLMDLGAKYEGYCADITRTYPVNGKFTERQRKVYDIVVKANRAVAEKTKPGMTLRDMNDIAKEVLAQGCIELGLIKDASEIGKYYMHSVSHHLGIDVHDTVAPGQVLKAGNVVTDEPGLYIDEWAIGIRVEDDLLLTEDGCICLSQDVIRTADEIEAFMADR